MCRDWHGEEPRRRPSTLLGAVSLSNRRRRFRAQPEGTGHLSLDACVARAGRIRLLMQPRPRPLACSEVCPVAATGGSDRGLLC
jgi:hypothetical protein